MTNHQTIVAEIVSFALAEGVSDGQFVEISKTSEAFVRAAPGFISRTLTRGDDGRWTDYVLWQDMDAALAAGAAFPKQPFAAGLIGAINADSIKMQNQHLLWQMSA